MDGEKRRDAIMKLLMTDQEPLSGTVLANTLGVSRQIIVQDIALLRATNKNILSTNKGYVLYGKGQQAQTYKRVVMVSHTDAQTQEELNTIVDMGAKVRDVIVEHEVYGQISVDLFLASRRDVEEFMEKIRSATAVPLKELTGNVHYHTIEAEYEETLDVVVQQLKEREYLISQV